MMWRISLFILVFISPSFLWATEPELLRVKDVLEKDKKESRLSLNFQTIKIRSALQLLAEFNGINLLVDDKVKGSLSIYLQDVTWDQALASILQTQGLVKRPIAKGWFITPEDEVLKRDKVRRALEQHERDFAPLLSKIIQIHYSKAVEMGKLLKESASLSARGSVGVDSRTNSLWIQDSQEQLEKIEKSIRQLDRPIQQVSIEARIVSFDKSREQELGVRFGLTQTLSSTNNLGQSVLKKKSISRETGLLQYLTMDLPLWRASAIKKGSAIGLRFMRLGKNAFLDLELSALESEGGAHIISAPHLITADQQAAFIEAGEEIPYQEKTSSGATSVVFKKAVLALNVIPHIMPDHHIKLDLVVNQDQPSTLMVLDSPAIKARGIKTQVIVKDGETVVLGGIYEYSQNETVQRVPFLGSLPLLGYFFRYKETRDRRTELLIFLTPTLLKMDSDTRH